MRDAVFFTGDLHLGHKNLLTREPRPFKTISEQDEVIIANWNQVVPYQGGKVFILGDFFWYGPRKALQILERLHGRKHLILGNHDKTCKKKEMRPYFASVSPLLEVYFQVPPENKKQLIVMCHYSMRVWNKRHWGSWHLFGHSHGKLPPLGKSFDVGVSAEGNNYTPISLSEVVRRMERLEK